METNGRQVHYRLLSNNLFHNFVDTDDRDKVQEACKYEAIDFDMEERTIDLKVGAIVWNTGWTPYDATKIDNLGFGRYQNVVTNMMLERLASSNGPTAGKILRPSDDKAPETIAFAQCAGSRDENHLPYCSYICCMASLKHATYLRAQYPDAKIYIYYIDLRTPGLKYENFYAKLKEDENIFFVKGKVAEVSEERHCRLRLQNAQPSRRWDQNQLHHGRCLLHRCYRGYQGPSPQ